MLLDNYMTSTGSILKCLAMMQADICHEIMIDIFVKNARGTFGAMVHLGVLYRDNHQAGNFAGLIYRVTEQLVQNLPLTSYQEFNCQNGTFVLESTGGFAQAALSPCRF